LIVVSRFVPSSSERCMRTLILAIALTVSVPAILTPGMESTPDPTTTPGVDLGVRAMANSIAKDLAHQGPVAWLHYFSRNPQFFMASDGHLVFPNRDSADAFIRILARRIVTINMTWSNIRVDSLDADHAIMGASYQEILRDTSGHLSPFVGYFTGLAERTPSGWEFRNLHWSNSSRGK
jgi:hypothetical protein